jgi:uncharacterized cupin superfamily protein
MNRINLADLNAEESASPKGRFHRFRSNIAAALAAKRNGSPAAGHCPFEVELVRVPPRAANWPYHAHSAQWEFYLIVSGRGQVRTPQGRFDIREGDCLLHPPGEAHQLTNTGAVDLVYYVVANNAASDICHYPDSEKWSLPGQPKPVRARAAEYYDGEE